MVIQIVRKKKNQIWFLFYNLISYDPKEEETKVT